MTPSSPDRLARVRGALLGTFVGDALGMPYEGAPSAAIPERLSMQEARLGRGTYTDDTEMMIVVAEALAEGEIEPADLAQRFLDRHDPARGYGAGTLRVFAHWRDGIPVEEAAGKLFGGQGSLGNGAAMRVAPVGARLADDPGRLRDAAKRSARVTHAHPLGIDAAVAQAAAVGAATRGEEPLATATAAAETDEMRRRLADARRMLSASRPAPEEAAAALGNSSAGHESVPTALYAACAEPDFESSVTFAVRCGGDTDTIGAMAGAVAGAMHGAGSIPARWLEPLEDGPRGRSHVDVLATRLAGS